MFNPIESYREAGSKAAEAMNHRDQATVNHWRGYLTRMLAYENSDDRKTARAAYEEAYRNNRKI